MWGVGSKRKPWETGAFLMFGNVESEFREVLLEPR
jgi:hypothetical protein